MRVVRAVVRPGGRRGVACAELSSLRLDGKRFMVAHPSRSSILTLSPSSPSSESLCMQGIFHHSLGRKGQGYDLVQRGAKNDSGSHIVWHVYALMRRADKQFEEALECYRKAVAIEKVRLHFSSFYLPLPQTEEGD